MLDKIKLVVSLLLVVAGVVGYYMLADQALVVRVIAVIAGVVAAFALFATLPAGQRFLVFVNEAVSEARKVVWPTRQETIQTTFAVFVLVVSTGLFLWVVDFAFFWVIKVLLGRA